MRKHIKEKNTEDCFRNGENVPKMHGFRDGIKNLKPEELKQLNRKIISKSRENKVYRLGTIDGLVVVGIDGVETFGSYKKDWENSYKAKIKVTKYNNGEKQIEEKEYHKQINVVAKIVGKKPALILDYEKITSQGKEGKQEYEPNVGIKLIKRLKESYGRGIDVIVADALYLNDKFLEAIEENKYNAVIRLKGNNNSLLENAEGLFKRKEPKEWKTKRKVVNTNIHQSREIKAWEDTFEYCGRRIKVVKYEEKYKKSGKDQKDIIYVISTDVGMSEETINKIIHARWDIENNGFNELKNYWNMKHCYIAEENAIDVIIEMMIMSYNLWEMYLYQHIHNFEEMKITKIGYIEEVREKIDKLSKEELWFSSA